MLVSVKLFSDSSEPITTELSSDYKYSFLFLIDSTELFTNSQMVSSFEQGTTELLSDFESYSSSKLD